MRYCNKCGASLSDDAKFCTVCGTPVNSSGGGNYSVSSGANDSNFSKYNNNNGFNYDSSDIIPESGKRSVTKHTEPGKKFKLWPVIAAVAVLAAAYVVLLVLGIFSNPFMSSSARFEDLHRSITDPVVEVVVGTISGKDSKVAKAAEVDTDMTVTLDIETGNSTVDDLIEDSEITLMAKVDDDDALFGFEYNYDGSDLLSGTIVVTKEYLGIQLPELDDTYYCLYYEDIEDICEALDLDVDLSAIGEAASSSDGDLRLDVDYDEVMKIYNKYIDIFFSMVNSKNIKKSSGKLDVTGAESSVTCSILTFTPDADDIIDMCEKVAAEFEKDTDLRSLVEKFAEAMGDDYYDEIMDEYDDFLDEAWDNIEDDVEAFAERFEDDGYHWTIAYKGKRIYLISLLDEDDTGIAYTSSGKTLKSRSDSIVYFDEGDDETIMVNEYTLSGKEISGKFSYNDGWTEFSLNYDVDLSKKSSLNLPYGEISFKYPEEDLKISLSVEKDGSGSSHEISVRYEDETYGATIVTTDKSSKITEPKGAERVDADDLKDIALDMFDELKDILSEVIF